MAQQQPNPTAVGIDLGSFQSVIAVTQKTGIQVLSNEANFRETPNIVGYGPTERYLGQTGQVKLKTNFKDTITYITRFLGLSPTSPLLHEQKKFITASTDTSSGRVAFQVNYRGKPCSFLPEQVVAAFLSKVKSILEINKVSKEEPVVLSVPGYYNVYERQALLDAAQIAGIKVSRLLNEATAGALDYYMNHKNDFLAGTAKNILFVDFGHSKLSLTLFAFTKDKISILAQHHQRNLGCRDIDYLLLEFYRAYFLKTTNCDFLENRKATLKMFENIEKQRKILSANSEHSLNMEYLIEDNDLVYTMKRQEFEKIAEPIFSKVFAAMQLNKLEIDGKGIKLDSIELVGGGTRIPAFLRVVQQLYKMETARTINSSEAIAKGCALMSAFKNPNFKPSDITIQELNYYPMTAQWDFARTGTPPSLPQNLELINPSSFPAGNSTVVFPKGCPLPSVGTLKFNRHESTNVFLSYNPPIPGFQSGVGLFQSQPSKLPPNSNVVFNIKLDENGIFSIGECYAESVVPEGQKPQVLQKINVKQVLHKSLGKEELARMAQEEKVMTDNDNSTQQVYELKNKLESHIYATKEKLKTTYREYLTPAEIQKLSGQLDEINNWLYSADVSTSQHVLHEKRAEIDAVLQPALNRIKAHEEFKKIIAEGKVQADRCARWLQENDRRYAHIPLRERQAAMIEVDKLKQFLANAQHLQNKAPKSQPLMTSLDEIREQIDATKEAVETVMTRAATNMRRTEYVPPKQQRQRQQQQTREEDDYYPQQRGRRYPNNPFGFGGFGGFGGSPFGGW